MQLTITLAFYGNWQCCGWQIVHIRGSADISHTVYMAKIRWVEVVKKSSNAKHNHWEDSQVSPTRHELLMTDTTI